MELCDYPLVILERVLEILKNEAEDEEKMFDL